MIDDNPSAAMFAAKAQSAAQSTGKAAQNVPELDKEPAWKDAFRQTLSEILDKGFGNFAEEIRIKKMEELREKILESMGLSESDLENMPPEQRQRIEKMVAAEIEQRLAAEDALDGGGNAPANPDGLATEMRATGGQIGNALALIQAMDEAAAAKPTEEDG